MDMSVAKVRAATPDDAPQLATLVNEAGQGMPLRLWASLAGEGEPAVEVGIARVRRPDGPFSYRQIQVMQLGELVVGMLRGYPLDSPDMFASEASEDSQQPLTELKALAEGSWYLNALAVFHQFRGRGFGDRLLERAFALARNCEAPTMSLIVSETNIPARRLYERQGFVPVADRPMARVGSHAGTARWLLLSCPVR